MGLVALILLVGCRPPAPGTAPVPPAGAVAADHRLASEAGARVLRQGGNAVDAAIAAALSSGVVQPSGSGLGGGGFALVVEPDGDATFLDFREVAPSRAGRDTFRSGASSREGGLAVAVPSEALGLAELHRRWGRVELGVVVAPAVAQARDGFALGRHLEQSLLAAPDMRALFTGDAHTRPGLAQALVDFAATRGEAFRTGWVAEDFVGAVRAAGGVLERSDLEAYTVKERTPLRRAWKGRTVWTAPPPSSGGVALLQMLGATEAGASPHCEVEAAKHAMADRAAWGGDPDFVPVPVDRLLSAERIAAIRADCGPTTFPPDHYGGPAAPPSDAGTLHISVIDGEGMAVALTTTINTSFGSKVVAPRSGIVLNNEMDDFATRPGEPNAFGLVQGEQNAVEPGKRPLSSMTPTVVVGADGRPELAVGASGGPFIITATWQVLTDVLDRGLTPAQALAEPRWHHQWQPPVLVVENGLAEAPALEAAGHVLRPIDTPFAAVQVAQRTPAGLLAASDPRKHGEAVVVAPP